MRTTKTMKSISLMYDGMHLNEEKVYHKAKLLLDIYRDVNVNRNLGHLLVKF